MAACTGKHQGLRRITGWVFLFVVFPFWLACSENAPGMPDIALVRVGQQVGTSGDYLSMWEFARLAYPEGLPADAAQREKIKLQVLNEMVEALVVSERARELGLSVSAKELNQAVAALRQHYSEAEFEEQMLKQAISFVQWKKRLRQRLLADKVVAVDLGFHNGLQAEDIQHLSRHPFEGSVDATVQWVRKLKTEQSYRLWLIQKKKQFQVVIDGVQWQRLVAHIDKNLADQKS